MHLHKIVPRTPITTLPSLADFGTTLPNLPFAPRAMIVGVFNGFRCYGYDTQWFKALIKKNIFEPLLSDLLHKTSVTEVPPSKRRRKTREAYRTYFPLLLQEMPPSPHAIRAANREMKKLHHGEQCGSAGARKFVDSTLITHWFKKNKIEDQMTSPPLFDRRGRWMGLDFESALRDLAQNKLTSHLKEFLHLLSNIPVDFSYSAADLAWHSAAMAPVLVNGGMVSAGSAGLQTPVKWILDLSLKLEKTFPAGSRFLDIGSSWGSSVLLLHLLSGFETVGIDLNPALVEGFKTSAKTLKVDTAKCQVYRQGIDVIDASSNFDGYLLTAPFDAETHAEVCGRLPIGARVYSWGASTSYLIMDNRFRVESVREDGRTECELGCFVKI